MKRPYAKNRMNKTQLTVATAVELGDTSAGDVARVLDAILTVIVRSVAAGNPVVISNFGTWTPKTLPPRAARNPQTGDTVTVPAQQHVRFRVSPRLRASVRAADPAAVNVRKRPKPR